MTNVKLDDGLIKGDSVSSILDSAMDVVAEWGNDIVGGSNTHANLPKAGS